MRSQGARGAAAPGQAAVACELAAQARAQAILAQACRALEAAHKHKQEVLALISHELLTPLHQVMGFAELLQEGVAGPLNAQQRDVLAKVFAGADRMLGSVSQLVDLAHLQAGKAEIAREPTALPALVEAAAATARPAATRAGLRLSTHVATGGWAALDRRRVQQVLAAMLSNAIKFTPAGGEVALRAAVRGNRVELEVRDSGIGIASELHPSLFEPFWQVDMSATRRVGGLGLGLSYCQEVVAAHGGRIEVESEPGRGSRFRVLLPAGRRAGRGRAG